MHLLRLNTRGIWSRTPQISDFQGLIGEREFYRVLDEACGYRNLSLNQHFAGCLKISCFKGIKIDTARNRFPGSITTVPVNGV